MNWRKFQPLTELDILRITFIYEAVKEMSHEYRVNMEMKRKKVDEMNIYADFLHKLTIGEMIKGWRVDFKSKTLIYGGTQYIENSIYDMRNELIVIDEIKSDMTKKECNNICFEIIENLYHKYKYSRPTEKSEKYRQREYFRALKPDEMTDEQLVTGEDRNYTRAALEAFILCASLAGYLTWDEEQMGNHWFYQGKDKDLIILKKWIKC